jgi:DNA-directed RNA polymerase alpha subunit
MAKVFQYKCDECGDLSPHGVTQSAAANSALLQNWVFKKSSAGHFCPKCGDAVRRVLQQNISDLPIRNSAKRGLLSLGVKTLADLCLTTEALVLRCPNVGRTTVEEIKAVMSSFGLSFSTPEEYIANSTGSNG